MADIIAFSTRSSAKRPLKAPSPQSAQILFFTGVRYMRYEQIATASSEDKHPGGPQHEMRGRGGKRRA